MIKYNLLLYLISPYLLFSVIFGGIRKKSGFKFILQRLGLLPIKRLSNTIWLHAASIGETKLAIVLYKKLKSLDSSYNFLITTNTESSSRLVKELNDKKVEHLFLPIDWFLTMKRFCSAINPKICIIIETEIWPNLLRQCKQNNIPSIIVNARLSKKTTDKPGFIKDVYRNALQSLTMILCKSDLEKEKYLELGAIENKIKVTGNLKFAEYEDIPDTENLINRKYVLAASTHNDEEIKIIREWLKLRERKLLLVIVPRHPERLGEILSQIPLSAVKVSIRSRNEKVKDNTQVYIADTYGELNQWIQHSEFIFMGGSLIDHGGQNFLEAAPYGKTVIVGPFMYNFISETEEFLKKNALLMIKEAPMLKSVFEKLIRSRNKRELFGNNAKKLIESKKSILGDYCKHIQSLVNE